MNAWLVVTIRISGFAGMFDYGQVVRSECFTVGSLVVNGSVLLKTELSL